MNRCLKNPVTIRSPRLLQSGVYRALAWTILVMSAALVGCGEDISLHDDIDIHLDLSRGGTPPNRLHSPYVRGAQFKVSVRGKDTPRDVAIVSGNSQILRKDSSSDDGRTAEFTAVGEGSTSFRAVKGTKTVRAGSVAVYAANRATLHFHGDVLFDRFDEQADTVAPRVLVGGKGTFLVRYFHNEQRLYGHGVLSVDPPEGTSWDLGLSGSLRRKIGFVAENEFMSVRAQRTHVFEDREWVTFSPKVEGEYTLILRADGEPVGEVTIKAVGRDTVEAITLRKMHESGMSNGDLGLVLAQAYDIDGNPIYGVDYRWDVDGHLEPESGDLYRYEYDKGRLTTLCAMFDAHESLTQIHASKGYVSSTNKYGCNVSSDRSVNVLATLFLLFGALAYLRRC